jgi:uncharacterized membrane protein
MGEQLIDRAVFKKGIMEHIYIAYMEIMYFPSNGYRILINIVAKYF